LSAASVIAADKEELPYKYYFAGAYVNQDSQAFLKVLNPGDEQANIEVKVYYKKDDEGRFVQKIPAHSAADIDFASYVINGTVFGGVVSSDKSIVVEHVQFDGTYSGGFGSALSTKPGFVWYFGEGYSSGMVKTYLYILNPSDRNANIGVTLYYENGEKKTFNIEVPSMRFEVIDLKDKTMPEKRFGIKVTSTAPIVVEAGDFNKKFSSGSGGLGSQILGKKWYFAEGYTSDDATEFLNILNPSMGISHIKVTFYDAEGKTRSFDDTVPPNSKKMFLINNYVERLKWYSTVVESDIDVAAELTHYDESYSAGHGGLGSTSPSSTYYFAGGFVDDKVKSYVAVFNPSDKEASLEVTFYYADGTVKSLLYAPAALSRSTIDLNQRALKGIPFGMKFSSSQPIVAQFVLYDQKRSAGYGTFGISDLVYVESEKPLDEGIEGTGQKSAELGAAGYTLLKEEVVSPSRFNEAMTAGISEVKKSYYSYDGKNINAWSFEYSDAAAAEKAFDSVLSGGMFKMLETSPADVMGRKAYRFVAEKSEGYLLQDSQFVRVFLAERGGADKALGLAEMVLSPADVKKPLGLGWVIVIIAALVLLVVFLRMIFRKKGKDEELEEGEGGWEDVIPSARPKHKHAKHHAHAKKAEKEHHEHHAKAEKKENKEENEGERKEEHHKQHHAKHHHVNPDDVQVREIKEHVEHSPSEEMPETIPDYEDVFRHVNRDMDEVKPK
jgi:hypothetical protein